MSRTLTNQAHLFPASGTEQTWTASTAVHSVIPYDLPSMLNNLKGYVDLCAGYCQAPDGSLTTSLDVPMTSREFFVGQVPTIVPLGSRRMVWTAGISAALIDASISVTAMTVYLSPSPYVGVAPPTAFDTTLLPPGYASRSKAITNTGSYELVNDSVTGLTSPPGWDQGSDRLATLILTATAETADLGNAVASLNIHDFSWWFLYE